jgi:hypothetical protein
MAKTPARRRPKRNPARKTTTKRKSTVKRKSTKRSAAAKKAAATRKRNALARSRAAKKAAATRKRRSGKTTTRRKTVKRKSSKRSAAAKKAWRTRRRKMSPTKRKRVAARKRRRKPMYKKYRGKALRKARRAIKRPRSRLARAYKRHYKMRSNAPATLMGGLMEAVKAALPIAGSLYLTRIAVSRLASMEALAPMTTKLQVGKYNLSKPLLSAGFVALAHYGTKKGALKKWRGGIMLGTTLNLIDSMVSTFAPDDVKSMFGLSGDQLYAGMGDYVQVGDYMQIGDVPPIDDDITLSDYVEVGGIEAELGALEADLGVEADLGGFEDRRLGGVHRGSMLKPVGRKAMLAPIPQRSFTKRIPEVSDRFDADSKLYGGIFSGGF